MSHLLVLAVVDVAEDPGQARPQDHPGVLLLLQDVELQQVADDLPGEEDVDFVESPEDIDALLHCGSSEEVGGNVLDLVAKVCQTGLPLWPMLMWLHVKIVISSSFLWSRKSLTSSRLTSLQCWPKSSKVWILLTNLKMDDLY